MLSRINFLVTMCSMMSQFFANIEEALGFWYFHWYVFMRENVSSKHVVHLASLLARGVMYRVLFIVKELVNVFTVGMGVKVWWTMLQVMILHLLQQRASYYSVAKKYKQRYIIMGLELQRPCITLNAETYPVM